MSRCGDRWGSSFRGFVYISRVRVEETNNDIEWETSGRMTRGFGGVVNENELDETVM